MTRPPSHRQPSASIYRHLIDDLRMLQAGLDAAALPLAAIYIQHAIDIVVGKIADAACEDEPDMLH